MKNISIYLFILACLHSHLYGMVLEEIEFNEFLQNKKLIVELGKKQLSDPAGNRLLAQYAKFATDEEDVDDKLQVPSLQCKIKEMFDATANNPAYKDTLSNAIDKKTDADWDDFRKTNGKLLREFLATKGFVVTDPKALVKGMLEANKDIQPESAEYAIASSFLIYYTRGTQRNVTGKKLAPIPIS